jgi:hypothetical protein
MRLKSFFAVALFCAVVLFAQSPRGTVPRPDAAGYAAHAGQENFQIGASLLSHKDAKKVFAADVNQCCLVVEVAFYPSKNNFVKIEMDSFMLREAGKEVGIRPSPADVLAARLETRPPSSGQERAGVSSTSEVGYGRDRGYDPNTGQTVSRGGIYQRQSVGVGIPVGGKQQTPQTAAAGNRRAIEAELTDKMLPETSAWEPVAGYLYFSVPKKSKDGYELVYTVDDKKVVLPLK